MMKRERYAVEVKTRSRSAGVEACNGGFVVRVVEAPHDGMANRAVVKAIARHLGVAPSTVSVYRGLRSRHKIIEIAE